MNQATNDVARMSLRAGFAWMLGGNLVFAASQWLLLIVLAKFIGVEAVGQFALGLAVAAPIFAFASLRLRAVQATDVNAEYSFGTYLGFTLVASLAALLVVTVVIVFTWRNATGFVILLMALAKGLEMISDIAQGLMQQNQDFRAIAWSQAMKGATGVMGMAICAMSMGTILPAVAGLVASRAVSLAWYDLPTARRCLVRAGANAQDVRPRFVWSEHKALLVIGFPIGLVLAFNTLQQSLPRFAIVRYFDEAAVGYYSAIAYVVVAAGMIVNALGQAALPKLAQLYVGDRAAYLKVLCALSGLVALFGLIGVVLAIYWGAEILTLLYTEDFGQHAELFTWIMAGGAFSFVGAIVGVGVTAARRFTSQAVLAGCTAVLVLIACFVLVPMSGLVGAAIAVAISAAFKLGVQAMQIVRLVFFDSEKR